MSRTMLLPYSQTASCSIYSIATAFIQVHHVTIASFFMKQVTYTSFRLNLVNTHYQESRKELWCTRYNVMSCHAIRTCSHVYKTFSSMHMYHPIHLVNIIIIKQQSKILPSPSKQQHQNPTGTWGSKASNCAIIVIVVTRLFQTFKFWCS